MDARRTYVLVALAAVGTAALVVGLVAFTRREPPGADRVATFAVIDAAFSQRRKTLRAALAGWAGSAPAAEERLRAAGIDPSARGETLTVEQFASLV